MGLLARFIATLSDVGRVLCKSYSLAPFALG